MFNKHLMIVLLSTIGLSYVYAQDAVLDSTHLGPAHYNPLKTSITLPGGPFLSKMSWCVNGIGNDCTFPVGNGTQHCPDGYTVNPNPTFSVVAWYNPGRCFIEGTNLSGTVVSNGKGYLMKLTNSYLTTGHGCNNYSSVQFSYVVYCDPV